MYAILLPTKPAQISAKTKITLAQHSAKNDHHNIVAISDSAHHTGLNLGNSSSFMNLIIGKNYHHSHVNIDDNTHHAVANRGNIG